MRSNIIITSVQPSQPEPRLSTSFFQDGTAEHEAESFIPISTTPTNELAVTRTCRASDSCNSTSGRGLASLALIFQPGYDIIQRGLMPKLSFKDLKRLRKAAAQNTELLRNLSSPYLHQPQVRCQNSSPMPITWKAFQRTEWHGGTEQALPRQPCRKELHTENIGVDLAVCDGFRLGLPTGIEHGEDFLVCKHCESLGKPHQAMARSVTSIKPVGDIRATAELCADCALDRQILRPHAVCQCESQFQNFTLCWDCRVEYPRQWLCDVICEAAAFLPVMDSTVEPSGCTWSTLERWILPPAFEPRSGCLDCGIDYFQSGQTWFNLWTATETSGGDACLPCTTTPQSETVCLYCLLPANGTRGLPLVTLCIP